MANHPHHIQYEAGIFNGVGILKMQTEIREQKLQSKKNLEHSTNL
jgi:hypothetical protein